MFFALALVSLFVQGQELDKRFVHAIHMVETGGREGRIMGDGGRALGPLQIHKSYWLDSRVIGYYEDCASLAYSTKVMQAYLQRYAREAIKSKNFEVLARVHNGGPSGARNPATARYWLKVKYYLAR